MATEVKVPTLGESVTEATVGEWLKQPGDAVEADEPIVSLETDKVAVEVPSPVAGVLAEFTVELGDTVDVGAVIAKIEEGAEGKSPSPSPAPASAKAKTDDAASQSAEEIEKLPDDGAKSGDAPTMSPAVRRAVLEHGVDPTTIKGTGKDGRLTKEDVLAAAKSKGANAAPAPSPSPSPSPAPAAAKGERREERVKMTRMRQTIAKRLKGAQEEAALLT
ncbi:MAG: biotin/lipoyl-containing protein, partial [Alteraurantiacibacter sp.]